MFSKRRVKIIASVLAFSLIATATGKFLRYILTDDASSYTRYTFHEMYEQDNIDVLFVGSSHCYRSFDPKILDLELGMNTFNGGSSEQFLDGSEMIIKEADRYNNLKHIYLEVYFGCSTNVKKERTSPVSTYIISDYMKPSVDKYEYLLQATNPNHYANSFIVSRRNWEKLLDIDYIKDVMVKKNSSEYKDYDYSFVTYSNESYEGKGYVASNEVIMDWDYFTPRGWEPIELDNISQDWRKDLDDIINYCDKKHIELTIVASPMSNYFLTGLGNYDDYIQEVKNVIGDRDVDYYDFNLCREKYFPNTSYMFKDEDHVNKYGAQVLSHSLAQLATGQVSPEEMFYDSYREKVENLDPTVFGVSYCDEENKKGKKERNCRIITNAGDDWEYRVYIKESNGTIKKVKKYSESILFSISPKETGKCVIEYRNKNDRNTVKKLELTMKK